MSTETDKPTPESTGDPKARTRAEVKAKREEKREERRAARAEKAADKESRAAEKAAAKESRAASSSAPRTGSKGSGDKGDKGEKAAKGVALLKGGVDGVRTLLGQVVWIVAVVCALFLAVGALCIALDANRGNELVEFVLRGADVVSLGIFSLEDGIKTFVGVNSDVKNALVNYGIGAVAYLVVGRVLERVIRP